MAKKKSTPAKSKTGRFFLNQVPDEVCHLQLALGTAGLVMEHKHVEMFIEIQKLLKQKGVRNTRISDVIEVKLRVQSYYEGGSK